MKVLFAVNNDDVSEAIVGKYQKEYKEILSYKNVYYFNAILREIQKDKSYSRIVISEDLEPFANNNYDSIDKFLLEKYSIIAEEAKEINGQKIDIIIICADRRKKTDNIFAKLYKIGIYNAIIGQDRSIDEVCRLIYQPRDKEDAKIYYSIQESELGETESDTGVSEAEVSNILTHYARLGKDEDKYLESFNNIVSQYSDEQLKIIIKFLPLNVKAVLEERSPKYQQLVTVNVLDGINAKKQTQNYKNKLKETSKKEKDEPNDVVDQLLKPKKIKQVLIPTNLKTENVQKINVPQTKKQETIETNEQKETPKQETVEFEEPKIENQEEAPKKGRGRPRKNPISEPQEENKTKRGRGRPRKNPIPDDSDLLTTDLPQEKTQSDVSIPTVEIPPSNDSSIDLFDLDDTSSENEVSTPNEDEGIDLFSLNRENEPAEPLIRANDLKRGNQQVDLFNLDDESEEEEETETEPEEEQEVDLFSQADEEEERPEPEPIPKVQEIKPQPVQIPEIISKPPVIEKTTIPPMEDLMASNRQYEEENNSLIYGDRKVVAFVGTTKNGTSFVVNNTAEMLSTMGIETAILDMTKSKNAYYIYTNNEESLRNISRSCMDKLEKGVAEGIKVHKNLTVYSSMPGPEEDFDIDAILKTLTSRYSAVIIDTDFETQAEIFEKVQEIYLVQSMDVLTIQPLTAFLRNLKSKDILKPEKLRIVINKSQKIKNLNIKTLIGGMSCYNSPSMTYMTELFSRDNIKYCEIPFEIQNYVKYLNSLVVCSINLNGYTKTFMSAIRELANMVYPLVNKQVYSPMKNKKRDNEPFSNQVNDTLNKMRGKY